MEFSKESRIGFNGKVSDEGDIVEGKVGNIRRTIDDFGGGLSIGGIELFFILNGLAEPPSY